MNNHLTLHVERRHIVRMDTGQSQVEFHSPSLTKMNVVTMGRQGPVGTVAEEVLRIAKDAEVAANTAKILSNQTAQEQSTMVDGMTMTIEHYIGTIGAQE